MAERQQRMLPTVADTEALGRELAAGLGAGDLVVLDGPLGAGKTADASGGDGRAGAEEQPCSISPQARYAKQNSCVAGLDISSNHRMPNPTLGAKS